MLNQTATRSTSRGLIRILGVGFGLAVIVGSTLGIGILRTPGLVAGQLPNPTAILAVWIAGGLYTLVGAVCLAELGTMLPEAGGYYVYARRAFGETVGFAVGWTDWLTYCAVLGYVSIAIGEFAALLLPSLGGHEKAVAILTLAALAALQLAGLRVSSRFQEITTVVKFGAFLTVVLAAMVFAPGIPPGSGLASQAPSFSGLIVALQSVVITYGGWQSALYFAEEDRDPNRNLPRSMIGGVASVIVVYLLVNVALLSVLPLGDLARSTLPAADAAQLLLGGRGREIITILSIVSLPPMLNAILMIGTRILFAMGRDGLLWRRAASVTARGTPAAAMLATTGRWRLRSSPPARFSGWWRLSRSSWLPTTSSAASRWSCCAGESRTARDRSARGATRGLPPSCLPAPPPSSSAPPQAIPSTRRVRWRFSRWGFWSAPGRPRPGRRENTRVEATVAPRPVLNEASTLGETPTVVTPA